MQPPKEPFNDLYDVSDREQEVVTSARRIQKTAKKVPGNGGQSRASAACDAEPRNPGHDQLENEHTEAILGDLDLESSSPAMEMGRRERATPTIESSVLAISKFKRRPPQASILGRGPGRARSSSVESDLADDNGLMSVGRNQRRPRKQSVNHNIAPVLPSSIALQMGTPAHVGSAMKIANFKRRAREPSILGTAQKAQATRYEYDYEDEDEDDFNPDDESTPLHLSKARNMNSSSAASSAKSRKRKLSAVQVPQSSPTLPAPQPVATEEAIPSTEPLEDNQDSEPEEEEHLMPSIEAGEHTPELFSETMAPPRSSSSSPPSPQMPSRTRRPPSRGRRPLRNRTPLPRTQDSPMSSPPSLTHSPNRPPLAVAKAAKPKPKKAAPAPSTFSTAQLQALLPRRRRRANHDTFSIPSSDDEVDISRLNPEDDELTHLSARPRARRPKSLRTPAPLKRPATKGKQPIKAVPKSGLKRTYGSKAPNAASDKENEAAEDEVDPDDSLGPLRDVDGDAEGEGNGSPENSQEMEKRVGKELKLAARKFQEVDKWELEFEEITASSSSPRDAR